MDYSGVPLVTETGVSGLTTPESNQLFQTSLEATLVDVGTDVDAILVDTGTTLPASIAALPTGTENADAYLDRSIQGGANGGRTVRDALRANRNRVVIDPVLLTITVYEEDDSTVAWSGSIATGARDPINAIDPA